MNVIMKWNTRMGLNALLLFLFFCSSVFLLRVSRCRHSPRVALLRKAIKTSSASALLDKWYVGEEILGRNFPQPSCDSLWHSSDLIISNLNGYNLSFIQSLSHDEPAAVSQWRRYTSVLRGHCAESWRKYNYCFTFFLSYFFLSWSSSSSSLLRWRPSCVS